MYNWITLLYSRNQHNIVNQLYFNLKNYVKNKIKIKNTPKFEVGQSEPAWRRCPSILGHLCLKSELLV